MGTGNFGMQTFHCVPVQCHVYGALDENQCLRLRVQIYSNFGCCAAMECLQSCEFWPTKWGGLFIYHTERLKTSCLLSTFFFFPFRAVQITNIRLFFLSFWWYTPQVLCSFYGLGLILFELGGTPCWGSSSNVDPPILPGKWMIIYSSVKKREQSLVGKWSSSAL